MREGFCIVTALMLLLAILMTLGVMFGFAIAGVYSAVDALAAPMWALLAGLPLCWLGLRK